MSHIWGTASSSPNPTIRRTYTDSPRCDGCCVTANVGSEAETPIRKEYQISVIRAGSGMLKRMIAWLRAGYPPNAPQHGHIALLALYSAEPNAARVLRRHAARAGADEFRRA